MVSNVTNYINALNSIDCSIHVNKPTRVTASTSSCIDHVYSNYPTSSLQNYIILSDVSDHFGILTKLCSTAGFEKEQPVYLRKKSLSDLEWAQFNHELKSILNQNLTCFKSENVNTSAQFITDTYNNLINKYMPLRKLSRKQKSFFAKPWFTKGMQISLKHKNRLYKLSKSSSNPIVIDK